MHYRSDNHILDYYNIIVVDKETDKTRRLKLEEVLIILINTCK